MKTLFFCLMFFVIPVQASFDIGFGLGLIEKREIDQTASGVTYSHITRDAFFLGMGLDILARYTFEASDSLRLGVVGAYGVHADTVDRYQRNTGGSSVGYQTSFILAPVGVMIGYAPTKDQMFALQYFVKNFGSIAWTEDNKSENPFRRGDSLDGNGFGLSYDFAFAGDVMFFSTQLRYLKIKPVSASNKMTSDVDSEFSKYDYFSWLAYLGFRF